MSDLLTGVASAAAILGLGSLAVHRSASPGVADAGVRSFGTLVMLLCGIMSALWWHQSATLSNRLIEQARPDPGLQRDVNALNGAAATFTGLALVASVFTGLRWRSSGSWLCLTGFLALLAMSGSDLRQAIPISLRHHLGLRALLSLLAIAAVIALFVWDEVQSP